MLRHEVEDIQIVPLPPSLLDNESQLFLNDNQRITNSLRQHLSACFAADPVSQIFHTFYVGIYTILKNGS